MGNTGALRPLSLEPVSIALLASEYGLAKHGPEAEVSGVALGSNAVEHGDLFVALRGQNRHGSEFWSHALDAGATAILTDQEGFHALDGHPVSLLVADDPRALLGRIAAEIYGTKGAVKSKIFGVTGTNGKTSTAFLLEALMRGMGRATALSTTAERQVRGVAFASTLTTPEAPDIHAMISRAGEEGVEGIAIEISAQALEKNRMDQVVCDVAGFTNLSHDHFEDFGSMERYLEAKARLFVAEHARHAVICVDSSWGQKLAERVDIPVTTMAKFGHETSDWTYQIVESSPRALTFELAARDGRSVELVAPLRGEHMVSNAALAVLMLICGGTPPEDFASLGPGTQGIPVFIPGRMEKVSGRSGPQVFVDAGRSADAYAQTLTSLRSETTGRLVLVCGTSGNRDATKRPIMGKTAAELADIVIVTDDDPRHEDPAVIRHGLLDGARSVDPSRVHEIPDPSEAIRWAISLVGEGDTVLWTGPGSQDYRDIAGVKVPYSARTDARAALAEAGWSDSQ